MLRLRVWLLIAAMALILLDKFSFISKFRDVVAIYVHKQVVMLEYKIISYPKLVFLQKNTQKKLETENLQLRQQVEKDALLLKQQNNQSTDAKEMENLNSDSDLYNNFKITMARGIIDVNYLVNSKLLIDRGSSKGVNLGSTVVNKDGVIGQISSVNPNNAQVVLITNPDYKIYLQNQVTKSKMLASGIGNNNMQVKYINKADKISVGDILVTTGLDDLYPANIPVARVSKVFYENNGFNSAICEPVVNFNKLQYLLVLKNAQQ
jgi:rod shape-determining protein MreC